MAAAQWRPTSIGRSDEGYLWVQVVLCVLTAVITSAVAAQTGELTGPAGALSHWSWLRDHGWLVLVVLVPVAFLLGRRVRKREPGHPSEFSKKPELIDEFDTENMELTVTVRALTAELEQVRAELNRASKSVAQHDKAARQEQNRQLETEMTSLRGDLARQVSRSETLEARLAQSPAGAGARIWPEGHEKLEKNLSPEDEQSDDETTVARLNRKLALARNTIAELLEHQQQLEDADARAAMDSDAPHPNKLGAADLRIELTRARRQLAQLRAEMQMQRDVIHALESDAVELKRTEKLLEDHSATEMFLQGELTQAIEEVARLKSLLKAQADNADADEVIEDAKVIKAMMRSSDEG